ncbi:hypothetical protein L195_g063535, partial [Trifolium pratense]
MSKISKDLKEPKNEGMLPLKKFLPNTSFVNVKQEPSSLGISPDNFEIL